MINAMDVTGVILAGGRSSRMGEDKALLQYNGKPFIQHIAETLLQILPHVIVISDRQQEYSFLNLPIYPDLFCDCGPLAGIHTGLVHATTPSVFIVSCDTPFITTELIVEMLKHARPDEIAIAKDESNSHPLIGIYPTILLAELEAELRADKKQVHAFLERYGSRVSILQLDQFQNQLRNINTPAEYNALPAKSTR